MKCDGTIEADMLTNPAFKPTSLEDLSEESRARITEKAKAEWAKSFIKNGRQRALEVLVEGFGHNKSRARLILLLETDQINVHSPFKAVLVPENELPTEFNSEN